MIILRDYQVRSCRQGLKDCEFSNIDKTNDYDKVLDEIEKKFFDDLHLQMSSMIAKLNDGKKRISFKVFKTNENVQSDNFLPAMESSAFNYDQLNF